MRLRRTGKRGNKVRSRNTKKRQTLRRKKRQSRIRGGGGWGFLSSLKVKRLPRIINLQDLPYNIRTISVEEWYDYIDLLKKYHNIEPEEFYNQCNEIPNVSIDSKMKMFKAFERHGVGTPLTEYLRRDSQ